MHLQVRFQPKSSPPDVEQALRRVSDAGVNLIAVGGSDLEFGGELALVPEHGQEQMLLDALAPYDPRTLDAEDEESGLTLCLVDHRSGGLHGCLKEVAAKNLQRGRIIRDILVGVPDDAQREAKQVPVQIYSEVVRSEAGLEGSPTDVAST